MGKTDEAYKIFSYISEIEIEYFSNMHLKELPYFQAKAYVHLCEPLKAQHLMTRYLREWSGIVDVVDNGYFGTTPFFISFVDEPSKLRRAQYMYLMSLCHDFMGEQKKAQECLLESLSLYNDNMLAIGFLSQGFLE